MQNLQVKFRRQMCISDIPRPSAILGGHGMLAHQITYDRISLETCFENALADLQERRKLQHYCIMNESKLMLLILMTLTKS